MSLENFLKIYKLAEKKYKKNDTRLAAEGWRAGWQVLISTIMSAQNRDEVTIEVGEKLFKRYPTLESLSKAKYIDVLKIFKSVNYNKTKAKHVIETAKILITDYKGKLPDEIDELVKLPGVGRKTANLVVTEVFNKPGICVDTHVHRISNIFNIVKTKSPDKTELALKELIPKKYWNKINRYFVLLGKDVPGYDKDKFLKHLIPSNN